MVHHAPGKSTHFCPSQPVKASGFVMYRLPCNNRWPQGIDIAVRMDDKVEMGCLGGDGSDGR